ncbi:hypothetical protein [Halosolutus gelatinilyticus]|uniref:hypothetical protein n=1 Tax=Halosolutus gelatinilyticus TaxID=2931975 RepID=UPI001FF525D7|nr:hypothetical protein [Halosolutus gelatinilyticus]
MDLRQTMDSRSRLGRLRDRVRSSLRTDATGAAPESKADAGGESAARKGAADDSIGNLFHCSTCRVVYIAAEKDVCSECENDVERVRSTFSHQ